MQLINHLFIPIFVLTNDFFYKTYSQLQLSLPLTLSKFRESKLFSTKWISKKRLAFQLIYLAELKSICCKVEKQYVVFDMVKFAHN